MSLALVRVTPKGGLEAMSTASVSIVGGGLSGLAAALAVVRDGGHARVYERRGESGARFHGDFQGLENWSTEGDVLEEIASFGIEPTPLAGHAQLAGGDVPAGHVRRLNVHTL